MDIGSIFLVLTFAVLVVLFIARPFYQTEGVSVKNISTTSTEHELSSALAERDRILNTLYELDFDHDLGKIPAGEYQAQRAALLEQGVGALKSIENLQADYPSLDDAPLDEALPADQRGTQTAAGVSAADNVPTGRNRHVTLPAAVTKDPNDELEALLADRRRARSEPAAGFCPNCGGPLGKSDHFCPRCGKKLA